MNGFLALQINKNVWERWATFWSSDVSQLDAMPHVFCLVVSKWVDILIPVFKAVENSASWHRTTCDVDRIYLVNVELKLHLLTKFIITHVRGGCSVEDMAWGAGHRGTYLSILGLQCFQHYWSRMWYSCFEIHQLPCSGIVLQMTKSKSIKYTLSRVNRIINQMHMLIMYTRLTTWFAKCLYKLNVAIYRFFFLNDNNEHNIVVPKLMSTFTCKFYHISTISPSNKSVSSLLLECNYRFWQSRLRWFQVLCHIFAMVSLPQTIVELYTCVTWEES